MLWRGRPDAPGRSGKGASVDRAQRLVASGGTWLWYLDPIDETHTRLIMRLRDEYRWTSPFIAVQLITDVVDFPFMRKVLLGIKARAEAAARGEVTASR
jgi:hypothetical protein